MRRDLRSRVDRLQADLRERVLSKCPACSGFPLRVTFCGRDPVEAGFCEVCGRPERVIEFHHVEGVKLATLQARQAAKRKPGTGPA